MANKKLDELNNLRKKLEEEKKKQIQLEAQLDICEKQLEDVRKKCVEYGLNYNNLRQISNELESRIEKLTNMIKEELNE